MLHFRSAGVTSMQHSALHSLLISNPSGTHGFVTLQTEWGCVTDLPERLGHPPTAIGFPEGLLGINISEVTSSLAAPGAVRRTTAAA